MTLVLRLPRDRRSRGELFSRQTGRELSYATLSRNAFDLMVGLLDQGAVTPNGVGMSEEKIKRLGLHIVEGIDAIARLGNGWAVERDERSRLRLAVPFNIAAIELPDREAVAEYLGTRRPHEKKTIVEVVERDLALAGDALRVGDLDRAEDVLDGEHLAPGLLQRRLSSRVRQRLVTELHLLRARLFQQRGRAGDALRALKTVERVADGDPRVGAAAAAIQSAVYFSGGQVAMAGEAAELTRRILKRGVPEDVELRALLDISGSTVFIGDFPQAEEDSLRARELADMIGDRVLGVVADLRMEKVLATRGEEREAAKMFERIGGAVPLHDLPFLAAWIARRKLDVLLAEERFNDKMAYGLVSAWHGAWDARQRHTLRTLMGIMNELRERGGINVAAGKQIAAQLSWLHLEEFGTTPMRCVRGEHRGTAATLACLLSSPWQGLTLAPRSTWVATYERQ